MKSFAFFGTPYVARDTLQKIVECGYVPSVVITSPDAARGRGMITAPCETKAWALEHHIPVLSLAVLDDIFLAELSKYSCEYGVAIAYGKILPRSILDAFPLGMLNVHYSLLPLYRGASPVETALWKGDDTTGVSIQKMVLAMDAGDILAQEEEVILPTDTTRSLRPRLIDRGARLLCSILPEFVAGNAIFIPQDESKATRAPKIKKEEGELILSGDALHNWNTYRALDESPGTYFYAEKEGKKIRIKITVAEYKNDTFCILRIVPEGKSEQDFSWLKSAGYTPVTSN